MTGINFDRDKYRSKSGNRDIQDYFHFIFNGRLIRAVKDDIFGQWLWEIHQTDSEPSSEEISVLYGAFKLLNTQGKYAGLKPWEFIRKML